jgi:hypothetical protein
LQYTSKTYETFLAKKIKYLKHIVKTSLQHVQHPDLLLKHPEATLATYKRRQMKNMRHASETLATYVYKRNI